ncbi:trimeric intracellular cation channel family protein [Nesterenkonia natronophila]|uniref:Trimeric intracellular cation channel family protein n=1 Tax=Nesterenkonia natronophila TaxID=2174932 RepID=A0A3A4F9E8_9MICC|nr:TRIC cation channel family protein [Nesterenkonia natronophila]RJN31464.1 trimeric intracellular cation channel family protein [Nesterenkonia natronophila]
MDALLLLLELMGIFAFAVSGSLLAARKKFDLVGSLLLASLAGLGGGVTRDVMISQGLPVALANPLLLLPVLLAVVLVATRLLHENRLRRTMLAFDAMGLSLFCLTGTVVAFEAGLNPVACALLGLTTAVGGGTLRDVVANEIPQIVVPRGIYALPAMLGAGLTVLFLELGVFNVWFGIGISSLVFTVRMLSLRFGWRIPLSGKQPQAE